MKHDLCGRLTVLACFTDRTGYDNLELFGDLCMNNGGKWNSLFGWPHAREKRREEERRGEERREEKRREEKRREEKRREEKRREEKIK